MRFILTMIFCLMGLLLAGCASDKQPPEKVSGFIESSCPPDKALVYLYRVKPWIGLGKNITMCVNYLPAASLSGHKYCPLILNPGFTQFGHTYTPLIMDGVPMGGTKTAIDLRVHLEAGQTYYIAYQLSYPHMDMVNRMVATNEMSTCSITNPLSSFHEN